MYKLKILPCRFEYENSKKHELHQYTFEYSETMSQNFIILFEYEVENFVMVYQRKDKEVFFYGLIFFE